MRIAALAAVPLILLLVNYLLATEFDRWRSLEREVERSHEMRAQLQTVLSLHQDVETGQRGFVLAREGEFLEPYTGGVERIGPAFARLRELAGARSSLAEDLTLLESLSRQKLDFASEVIELTRLGRAEEAARLVASGRGKALMDRIRAVVGRMDGAEQGQRAEISGRAATAQRSAQAAAFALQALLVILLLAALWFAARNFRAQRRTASRFLDMSLRQEAIFDAATDGMVIHDRSGRIESHNPSMARLFGYEEDELLGRNIVELFENPPSAGELGHFLDRLVANPKGRASQVREFDACRKDGSHFPVDVASSAVKLADGRRFLAVIRDATGRRQIERMKSEFVSTVSHELRTPLTSIAGSLGLLSGGAAGEIPEKAQRLIKIAHSNSERLVRLINDILDIEKIESGKMTFNLKPVELRPLLDQAASAIAGFAGEYGIELEVQPAPAQATVIADEDRLIQVLTNLLSNAIKFSPWEEKVEVSATTVGGRHRITVADRGPGIDDEFRSRIFGKFAQADSSDTRQKGGTGLGLSISREIVRAFGGTIEFEDREGGGTLFHVDLPAASLPDEPSRDSRASNPIAASGRPLILHVDDDPDTLRLVASAFEGRAELHSTPSVREAHASLHRQKFDAAILDLELADGSGLDLLPILRAGPTPTPAIIFSVHDANPALADQVDGIVTKSRSSLDQLVETVLAAAKRASQQTGAEL